MVKIVNHSDIFHLKSKAAKEQVSLAKTKKTVWFGIQDGDKFTAIGGVIIIGHKARFKGMWTDPEWRGQGLGTKILEAIYDFCRNRMDISLLEAYSVNPPIWERYGFKPVGKLPNGAVIMRKPNG